MSSLQMSWRLFKNGTRRCWNLKNTNVRTTIQVTIQEEATSAETIIPSSLVHLVWHAMRNIQTVEASSFSVGSSSCCRPKKSRSWCGRRNVVYSVCAAQPSGTVTTTVSMHGFVRMTPTTNSIGNFTSYCATDIVKMKKIRSCLISTRNRC